MKNTHYFTPRSAKTSKKKKDKKHALILTFPVTGKAKWRLALRGEAIRRSLAPIPQMHP